MDKYFKLPAGDMASWIGLAVAIVAIVAIAKHTPFVKKLV